MEGAKVRTDTTPLDSTELNYLVALNGSESFKRNFRVLLSHFKSLEKIYKASESDFKGIPGLATQSIQALARIKTLFKPGLGMDRIQGKPVKLVSFWDQCYPENLRTIPSPPPLLYVSGDISYQYDVSIGIVGTRRTGRYGLEQSFKFGKELASLGFTIISGGASGIDGEAHKGALDASGKTFAVFGSGIDVSFPASHGKLFQKISSTGAIISEFPPGTPPEPFRFPVRNRIIAGMSRGILVIQAPEKSGALITSEYAMEFGREVLAIPGRLDDPNALGTNQLIRDGATLVLSIEDILTAFNIIVQKRLEKTPLPPLDSVRQNILDSIGWEGKHIDEISHELKLPVSNLSGIILELQIGGYVKELTGKRYVRLAP